MTLLDVEMTLPKYIPMTAWLEHGPFAMWLVRHMKPRRIVELGTHHGYSYFAMCQAVQQAGLTTECVAIDPWGGDDASVFDSVVAQNRQYAGFSTLLRKTSTEALADVGDGSVDLLHLNGLLSYDDLKATFEAWRSKLSPSAVVLFHGTETRRAKTGVQRYWAEIAPTRPSINFRHCQGLGVLFWGDQMSEGLGELVEIARNPDDPDDAEQVAGFYAALGGQLAALRDLKEQEKTDLTTQIKDLQARLANAERRSLSSETVSHQLAELRNDLFKARMAPIKSLRRKYTSKIMYFLASRDSVFSERRRQKFLKSARKRDPRRSIPELMAISEAVQADSKTGAAGQTWIASGALNIVGAQLGACPRQDDRATVMVVSHDATRTGAPILALNLVRELSKRYNVVSVILGGGELQADFLAESVALLHMERAVLAPKVITERVSAFCKEQHVSKGFVNSVESRSVLPGLRANDVVSVSLLHEFAAYTHPETAFSEVFSAADQVVFSTNVTLENATAERGYEHPINVHVLPQGKCLVPKKPISEQEQQQERQWLDGILRPGGLDHPEFVVIGAGAIEIRKGIDLFIETATRVIEAQGGARFRFIWIGEVYGPYNEALRSVHLADQIKRAGLQTQVQIVRSTSEIEHAYATADMMLLSSRLDPLPNVAIDMLLAGKPVMCFDRTTGIADFLDTCDLREACVASYLDTSEMAAKITALANNPKRLAEVALQGTEQARKTFDFPSYVERLDAIANQSGVQSEAVAKDLDYLLSSGAFRRDFFDSRATSKTTDADLIRDYLEANRNGPFFKKPAPGFNQLIYAEENGWGAREDPFVQFLKAGRPNGRWTQDVIPESSPINPEAVANARVALHIHAYFVEELGDILARLALNATKPSLFISTRENILPSVQALLETYTGPVAEVQVFRNRGRDIAPLLTGFGPRLVEDFDIIGHLHTKKSPHVDSRDIVQRWIDFLMENTVGGPAGGAMLDRVVTAMWNTDLGIVYPDDPGVVGWTKNRTHAATIAARMGLADLPEKIDFPVGTMFWIQSDVLQKFVDLRLDWDDYPPEPLPIDGTMLHAIERLFGVAPGFAGLRSGVTNVLGVSR